MLQPNIVITGFMATGKSTVGRLLAERTGREFVDTDELIAERSGQSIVEIFEKEGESSFREWERRISRELADRMNVVIATGGRLMLDPLNALLLGQRSIVVALKASPDVILKRLSNQNVRRPLLETEYPKNRVEQLMSARSEGYSRFWTYDTSAKDLDIVLNDLLAFIDQWLQQERWREPSISHIPVRYPGGSYFVSVGWGLLGELSEFVPRSDALIVVTDANVNTLHAQKIKIEDVNPIVVLPAGEKYKTLESIREIYDRFLLSGIDRRGMVIALGGGVVGDMGGFAAATYMRGIQFIQCPTTVLSMVDASVGGKTGVDLPQGKNLVGAFKQPEAVVADLETLLTLPRLEFSSGMAEVVKHGMIASPHLLQQLSKTNWLVDDDSYKHHLTNMLPVTGSHKSIDLLQQQIVEAILIKRDVVEVDPFETDRRRILNLGHTFAHAIEKVSDYRVRHGQAVAIGLVAATHLSASLGFCKKELQEYVEEILIGLALPIRIPEGLSIQSIVSAMGQDKKKAAGRLNFVLIHDIGNVFVSDQVSEVDVIRTLEILKDVN